LLRSTCPSVPIGVFAGWLWHRRLAHVGMKNLHKLLKGEHVLGLTNVCFEKDRPCAACQAGKQVGSTHHSKNVMTTSRPLELLHMDLFGPVAYLSIGGSKGSFGKAPAPASLAPDPDPREELILLILLENQNHF
jgi:hypothetical protein